MCGSTYGFLAECFELIDARRIDPFTGNTHTRATLNLLGYNIRAMQQEIMELTADNLVQGPIPDTNSKYPGMIWIFKKAIHGYFIYIKLKIRVVNDVRELFIMSFAIDDQYAR